MNPNRAKLLIVHESESMRDVIRELMHDLSVTRIDEASDVEAALLLVKSNHYDLVLCEWNDARVTGIDLVRVVRHSPVGHDTPVLLISHEASARQTVEALEAGANGLLSKPFSTTRLCEKVMRIIAAHPPVSDFASERPSREDTWTTLH
jgi:CheY-like chemotaxis protein